MKKTVTINLDKTIFNIDDDAYELLEAYLQSLNEHFAHEEGGQEILNDIESRIAELFKERLGFGMQVITRQEGNEVIAIMGRPDEIETPLEGEAPDEGGTPGETASASSPTDENNNGNNSGSTPEPERRCCLCGLRRYGSICCCGFASPRPAPQPRNSRCGARPLPSTTYAAPSKRSSAASPPPHCASWRFSAKSPRAPRTTSSTEAAPLSF